MIITISKVRPKYIRTPLQNVLTSATSLISKRYCFFTFITLTVKDKLVK